MTCNAEGHTACKMNAGSSMTCNAEGHTTCKMNAGGYMACNVDCDGGDILGGGIPVCA
ncbi:MAG: hypothetical protein LKF76_07385 [Eggerthellaceae bacterium]|nr:hypothetical protein [Eggerthellaceae bacterium]